MKYEMTIDGILNAINDLSEKIDALSNQVSQLESSLIGEEMEDDGIAGTYLDGTPIIVNGARK